MTPEQLGALLSLGSLLKDLGAIGGLILLIWLLLEGRLVTRGHLNDVVTAERQNTADAKAERDEWKQEAKRLANDIIPPLLEPVKARTRVEIRELRESQEPR